MSGPRRDVNGPLPGVFLLLVFLPAAAGTVNAQEPLITDSLGPDALEEDALEPNALDEDALGLESFEPELFREWAQLDIELPVVTGLPPCPREAIHHYFCWRCWRWYRGISRVPLCPYHRSFLDPPDPPGVPGPGNHPHPEKPEKKGENRRAGSSYNPRKGGAP